MSPSYLQTGLTTKQAYSHLKKFGYNEFKTKREFTALKILASQFTSFLIIILIIAGAISMIFKETLDGIAILAIVVINALIGFIQEYKAENAVKTLKKLIIHTTIVLRDSQKKEIPIRELVPDDIVILSEGEKIPADLEIIEAFSLKVDEAVLTGESEAVEKKVSKGKEGLLFKGTLIVTGRAKAKVIKTGMNTEFGKIVHLVAKEEKSRSPLAIQLNQLGKKIGLVILILIAIVFVLGFIRNINVFHMFMTIVALGVSAIPEGLPIIATLTLAIGVQILAHKKAIVRKMNAIETLGATTVICSDKTGTLTLNEMTVKKLNTNFKEMIIPGSGYFYDKKITLKTQEQKKLLEICENCNNAYVDKNILGDPTEIALKILNRKARYIKKFKQLDENVFTSERKIMSTLHKIGLKKEIMAKGAFEVIIKNCSHILLNGKVIRLTAKLKNKYSKIADEYSKEALRVLAFAYKPYKNIFDEKNLIFVGIVGMFDVPRETVPNSIKIAKEAGIKVKIITGDNPKTAKAVGEQVGLKVNKIITGEQIDKLTDSQLIKIIYETDIFARTSPKHKYRIVDLLKKTNEIVAVTGDGVNDAPALKHADVGVAMGIKGTEAVKEVADIVLKDDNFTTIVNTIEEGRRIYNNILAFIKYMLSANFGSIMTVGVLTILGFPLPVLPLQILWINIATDALPALALGQSPAPPNLMKEKPHPKQEQIFKKFFSFIIIAVIIQTFANLAMYFYGLSIDAGASVNTGDFSIPSHARTLVFTQIVMFELLFAFVCKEEKSLTLRSLFSNKKLIGAVLISFIFQIAMIYVPAMQTVFKTTALTLIEWLFVMLAASTAFLVPKLHEMAKKLF